MLLNETVRKPILTSSNATVLNVLTYITGDIFTFAREMRPSIKLNYNLCKTKCGFKFLSANKSVDFDASI